VDPTNVRMLSMNMMSWRRCFGAWAALILYAVVTTASTHAQPMALPSPQDGSFRIVDVQATDQTVRYVADAGTQPNTCTFEIIVHVQPTTATEIVSFESADIVPKLISDCNTYLASLARALLYKGPLPAPHHLTNLHCDVAVLGSHQSGGAGGGFTSTPPGPWLVTKLFLEKNSAEVFMNLNAQDGIGEFTWKDEEYARDVMTAFASILAGTR
jgi:hypothetical protein